LINLIVASVIGEKGTMKLNDKQKADYFHRCFSAVDGLWFLKVEEKLGFEETLELDRRVWEIFPKIQAREIKSMLRLENNVNALEEALTTNLELKGFSYKIERESQGFKVIIAKCPWHDTMVESGREHLSARVGAAICPTEYSVWAKEFGDFHFSFESEKRLCNGALSCIMTFKK
jgi:hypothetical protein